MFKKAILLLSICLNSYVLTSLTDLDEWIDNSLIYENFNYLYRGGIDFKKQPKWGPGFNFNEIEKKMKSEEIVKIVNISKYLDKNIKLYHPVYIAKLSNGLIGVFKPEETLKFALAEVAAYKASKHLKLNLVPPTILKKYQNLTGSLQFFLTNAKTSKNYTKKINPKSISDMNIFFFVFGQTDNKPLNQIVQIHKGVPHLALIDNAHMYHIQSIRYGEKPYICINGKKSNRECPFDKAITINNIPEEKFYSLFSEYMPKDLMASYFNQSRRYGYIKYILDNEILWIQKHRLNYTDKYYRSTINELKRLTKQDLHKIWSDGLKHDKSYFSFLINLILERRDQVVSKAKKFVK